jgi:hypothetical protein
MIFIAHISRYNGLYRKPLTKRLIIQSADFSTAYDGLVKDYPDWGINMFWREYC